MYSQHFNHNTSFPGDLRQKYFTGGSAVPGTYTRASGSDTWTKK